KVSKTSVGTSSSSSSLEDLGEEIFHRIPRAVVGVFVVCSAFGIVVAGIPIGEGMDRTAIGDQLPVDAALAHFFFERGYFRGRNIRVVSAMEGEDLGFDVFCVFRLRAAEAAVETDNPREIGAAPGQFEHGGAAETITDGSDSFGIG